MATRLLFAVFDARLKAGKLSPAEYRRHLEVDPAAHFVRIRFKPGALRDAPPPGYDVDREVYFGERASEAREFAARAIVGLKRVLAEGDSWFRLPPIIRPEAIATRLQSDRLVTVRNIAHWGDTLSQMLVRKEYLDEIPRFNPDWFIFSGGGDDLQNLLAIGKLFQVYDPNRPIEQCLSQAGYDLLVQIAEGYRTLLNQIAVKAPNLRTICYGYDFPRPTYKEGRYIGHYLARAGYPKKTWDSVVKVLIDKLTASIKPVVESFPNSQFLDCRGVTAPLPFFDDMHPDKDGFIALALQFERALGVAMVDALDRVTKRRAMAKKRRSEKGTTRKRKVRTVAAVGRVSSAALRGRGIVKRKE
jgi:hypothetical protein